MFLYWIVEHVSTMVIYIVVLQSTKIVAHYSCWNYMTKPAPNKYARSKWKRCCRKGMLIEIQTLCHLERFDLFCNRCVSLCMHHKNFKCNPLLIGSYQRVNNSFNYLCADFLVYALIIQSRQLDYPAMEESIKSLKVKQTNSGRPWPAKVVEPKEDFFINGAIDNDKIPSAFSTKNVQ